MPDSAFIKLDNIITYLSENPYPNGCLKLTDREGYRIRIGDYRLLYRINKDKNEIIIFKVSHRKDTYKKR